MWGGVGRRREGEGPTSKGSREGIGGKGRGKGRKGGEGEWKGERSASRG